MKRKGQTSNPFHSLYSSGHVVEDTDSRTIFVSNVHFATTEDSFSQHFIKFGDVLKVVILTDAGAGQPKGSAYIEFMRKETAEYALSLDGTSFMSRILKILVATPGRLKDHIENTTGFATRLMGVKVLVLDEADHLLDMGFRKDIEKIIAAVPNER